ncbi:probable structure-specific endonuclease subunit SLX1 at N-terminal half [Coccomyxa sp. Obi]|nr:probable structure-specific endonuclease subunit SLX1 at N-terminal half [Coccomyxa sp. Obi]
MREFYGCYLLKSKNEKLKGKTYIGFTVNPKRRIRQHNGEISAGAYKTKSGRPWGMVLVVYGFPTKVQALQFEWAWQHPEKSLAVRDLVAELKGTRKSAGLTGAKGKLRLLILLLNSEQWRYFPLSVQFLSSEYAPLLCGLPPLPDHVPVTFAPAEDLPTVVGDDYDEGPIKDVDEAEGVPCPEDTTPADPPMADSGVLVAAAVDSSSCAVCEKRKMTHWLACTCGARCHIECLAHHFIKADPSQPSVPQEGSCPACGARSSWVDALARGGSTGWAQNRSRGRKRATLKADPSIKRSASAAAKSAEGASAAADGSPGASESPVQTEAAVKPPGRRARAGGRGGGSGSRAKTGASADAAADISASAAASEAAVAAASAAGGRAADRRPGRGRRRTTTSASLPGTSAGTSALHCSGLPAASSAASHFSTLAPPLTSAAVPSFAGLKQDVGATCQQSSSRSGASESCLAGPEPWVYDASPRENLASADQSPAGVSQNPSLDNRPISSSPSAADISVGAADVSEPPEQAFAAEEDAWCYVSGSPESILPHRLGAASSAVASPREWHPFVEEPPGSAGHTTSPEPVCLVSDSDSEAPLSGGPTGHQSCGYASLLQQSMGTPGKVQKRARSGCKVRTGNGTREAAKKSPRLVAVPRLSDVSLETARGVESPQASSSVGGETPGGSGHADVARANASISESPAGASFGGATPVSAWMASKLSLGASREVEVCAQGLGDLDSPICVPSPTPLRRRLAFRGAPVPAADVRETEIIVIE